MRRLSTDNGSFYGYLGDLCNAFDPHSGLVKRWHQLLFGCLLYEAFLLPFAVTFVTETPLTTSFRVFYAVELLFLADFYVQLNTGFYQDGNIHRDKRRARMKYVKSAGFLLDVVAILPLSIILSTSSTVGTRETSWYEFHKILRCFVQLG
ncbi:hypothetical protein DVH05_010106 [Phytophthora capsici]|nr:hypothetical protein DVH05_010106 [Phytophthora capsici]